MHNKSVREPKRAKRDPSPDPDVDILLQPQEEPYTRAKPPQIPHRPVALPLPTPTRGNNSDDDDNDDDDDGLLFTRPDKGLQVAADEVWRDEGEEEDHGQ